VTRQHGSIVAAYSALTTYYSGRSADFGGFGAVSREAAGGVPLGLPITEVTETEEVAL
jgi:hypothetical protein